MGSGRQTAPSVPAAEADNYAMIRLGIASLAMACCLDFAHADVQYRCPSQLVKLQEEVPIYLRSLGIHDSDRRPVRQFYFDSGDVAGRYAHPGLLPATRVFASNGESLITHYQGQIARCLHGLQKGNRPFPVASWPRRRIQGCCLLT